MLDPMFQQALARRCTCRHPALGLSLFYFCRPAIEQARWFIQNVPRDASALPHVPRTWNGPPLAGPAACARPADEVQSEMKIFLDALERHYGKRPIIYTTVDFYRDNRLQGFRGLRLLAAFRCRPTRWPAIQASRIGSGSTSGTGDRSGHPGAMPTSTCSTEAPPSGRNGSGTTHDNATSAARAIHACFFAIDCVRRGG